MNKFHSQVEELDNKVEHKTTAQQQRPPLVESRLSELTSDKLALSPAQFLRRRNATLEALRPIHCSGQTEKGNNAPICDGMFSTLMYTASPERIEGYLSNSNVIQDKVLPSICLHNKNEYESSEANKIRSLRVLYEEGLISKRKYTSIRNAGAVYAEHGKATGRKFEDLIPKITPYKKLMKFISSIVIEDSMPFEHIGIYKPLEQYLLTLAEMYLTIDKHVPSLHWFNGEKGLFYVAIGADGAPFGKDDCATAYLISFLNVLNKVASCDHNYLLMGANCEEGHPSMIAYTRHVVSEMISIEKKEYSKEGLCIKFKFELIPSDMKWIATMSGELNNAATFFSSFADVSHDNMMTPNGSIGTDPSSTWHPWNFQQRLEIAKKVVEFKSKQKAEVSRSKVTQFIAKSKSRQEIDPPLGRFVDKCMAEPLHVTNNVWEHWFKLVLTIAMNLCKGIKQSSSLSSLTDDEVIVKFLKCLKNVAKCSRLCKNVEQWFNEKRPKGLEFSYRFTGKESKNLSWNFAYLIDELLKVLNITKSITLQLHVLAYIALHLRKAASVYSRVNISQAEVTTLKQNCQLVFNAHYVFLGKVTPSLWTLGYVIPYHTAQLYNRLGFGLGLNTMQGREAKHIKLKKYMENTPGNVGKGERWGTVFRHEYVRLIWMRLKDPDSITYRRQGR